MNHSIRLLDIQYEKCVYNFRGHVDSVNKVKFSRFDNLIYSASSDKTLSIWDLRTGQLVSTFYGH